MSMDDDDDGSYHYDSIDEASVEDEPMHLKSTIGLFAPRSQVSNRVNTAPHVKSTDFGSFLPKLTFKCESLASTLDISMDDALALLIAYNFREDKFIDAWWTNNGLVRKTAGISKGQDPPKPPAGTTIVADTVSLEDVPISEADALPCEHWFSKETWASAVNGVCLSKDGRHGILSLRCPASGEGCTESVRHRVFAQYASPAAWAVYARTVVEVYVKTSETAQVCNNAACDQLLEADSYSAARDLDEVTCARGHSFCWKCGNEPHMPADCSEVSRWSNEMSDDKASQAYIDARTKPCPMCRHAIQKNEGCNHMTCLKKAGGCGHEFCWVCLNAWSTHRDFYQCNKRPDASLYDETKVSASEVKIKQMEFYWTRFVAQKVNKEEFEKDTYLKEFARCKQLLSLALSPSRSQAGMGFLEAAYKAVLRGRRMAKWAYAKGYFYPDKHPELVLFQNHQSQLESNVENLASLLMERSILSAVFGPAEVDLNIGRIQQAGMQMADISLNGSNAGMWMAAAGGAGPGSAVKPAPSPTPVAATPAGAGARTGAGASSSSATPAASSAAAGSSSAAAGAAGTPGQGGAKTALDLLPKLPQDIESAKRLDEWHDAVVGRTRLINHYVDQIAKAVRDDELMGVKPPIEAASIDDDDSAGAGAGACAGASSAAGGTGAGSSSGGASGRSVASAPAPAVGHDRDDDDDDDEEEEDEQEEDGDQEEDDDDDGDEAGAGGAGRAAPAARRGGAAGGAGGAAGGTNGDGDDEGFDIPPELMDGDEEIQRALLMSLQTQHAAEAERARKRARGQ